MFVAARKLYCSVAYLGRQVAFVMIGYFIVTGVAFPFVYGFNEIFASIGRFFVAFGFLVVAVAFDGLSRPRTSSRSAPLAYDPILIDDHERRERAIPRDILPMEAARAQMERDAQLAAWINRARS